MRGLSLLIFALLTACGGSQFTTRDPYADAGATPVDDAGSMGGGATGGGSAGGGTATGGGMPTGGGTSTGGGGGGGSSTGGGGGGGGTPSCSAATCASGCCANGMCRPGNLATECGIAGATCTACPPSDVCSASQTCDLDPASTWRVRPVSAAVDPDDGFLPWDDLSDPDPELDLWCPSSASNVSAVMPRVSNTLTPAWSSGGCTTTASQLLADGFAFEARDVDVFDSDIIAPKTLVPVTQSDLRAGTVTCSAGGVNSMTVQLTKE